MDASIRVLLVDDDPNYCTLLSSQLLKEGLQMEFALSGPEALHKAKAGGGNFHVAVIDQVMGPPNGLEIMLQLQQGYPFIESIILTAWGDAEPGERAMDLGAFRYMSKTVNVKELVINIRCAARFGRVRQRSIAMQTLISGGQRIGAAQAEEELYQTLYEEACKLLPSLDGFLISDYDEQEQIVTFPFSQVRGERFEMLPRENGNKVIEYVLRTKEPLLLAYGDKAFRDEHALDLPDSHLGYCNSELVVPMFRDDHTIGAILALTYNPNVRYTLEHLQVLQALANQVVVSIRNIRQLVEARQLKDATAVLASSSGKEAVLRAIVEGAHNLINSDFTGMILLDENGRLQKVRPVIPDAYFDRFEDPRQDRGVTREVVNTRRARIISDTRLDPLVKESVRNAGIRSMLALPLIHGERILGVLYTHIITVRYFSAHDVDLWTAFATQAAAALDRAIEQERHIDDFMRLADQLGTLNEKMNLKNAMLRVATAAKAVFEADACRLAYIDPATRRILDWTWGDGEAQEFHIDLEPRPDGLTNFILRSGEMQLRTIDDGLEPPLRPDLIGQGLKAVASLPLIYGGRMIGVLHCTYFRKSRPLDEHFKTLVAAFGARAATALHRASLDYKSDIWRDLDQKATTCAQLEELYTLFAEHAREAMGADFAVFYPYNPTIQGAGLRPIPNQDVVAGELLTPWQPPQGGLGGRVHDQIRNLPTGLLIVNNIDESGGRSSSRLAQREALKAFVALRLEVTLPDMDEPVSAGLLFLNYRHVTSFEPSDLVELHYSGELIAAGILRLNLQAALQKAFELRNAQLRAVIDIFRSFEYQKTGLDLNLIAQRAGESLGIDICTILEYDSITSTFTGRGVYGVLHPEIQNTSDMGYKIRYMDIPGPTIIMDVAEDPFMRDSKFAKREGVRSTIIYPLRVEGESFGLFFVNYRNRVEPAADDIEAISLFADLAAMVLHGLKLGKELNETRQKMNRHLFLRWVSMIEDTWRHTLIQKVSAIRNHSANLHKRFKRMSSRPPEMEKILGIVDDIDRLAAEVAAAPPRVPHSWEMEAELIPIAPLLEEVVERESRSYARRLKPQIAMSVNAEELGGAQILGYRRWLIYALEGLLENSRRAMPRDGQILITGKKAGMWAEVRIRDSGKGISEEVRQKLFRELIPKSQDSSGMGIGGLLAATLIEDNGGSIELEEPGPGNTTVLIRLPISEMASSE